jgi:hypothetical protein
LPEKVLLLFQVATGLTGAIILFCQEAEDMVLLPKNPEAKEIYKLKNPLSKL